MNELEIEVDEKMQELITLVKNHGRMNHEDERLIPFCDDRGEDLDTFNRCCDAGLLNTWHDSLNDQSFVEVRSFVEE